MLGIEPILGRLFVEGEDKEGADREVILSYGLWQRRFSGDPNVLDKPILLDGNSYVVVGVMPSGFQFAPFWATTRLRLLNPLSPSIRDCFLTPLTRSLRLKSLSPPSLRACLTLASTWKDSASGPSRP